MFIKDNQPLKPPQVIKHYREAGDHSQLDLAIELGVQRQTISMWENGKQTPSVQNWYNLVRVLRIPQSLAEAVWRENDCS